MKLQCKVERVFYPNEKAVDPGNWYILGTDAGKVTGEIDWRPAEGERLELEGEWGEFNGGPQFKFISAVQNLPVCGRDQLAYVCEKTKGIGESMFEKIWKRYGDDWEGLEQKEIAGMGMKLYTEFVEQIFDFRREKEKAEAIAFLMSKGCAMKFASAAYKQWEKSTKSIVNNNCYRLTEIPNYGFMNVDTSIRQNFGITDTDPRRITAAVIYSMQQLTGTGSTVISWYNLRDEVFRHTGGEGLSITLKMVSDIVEQMFKDMTLHAFPGSMLISLEKHYEYESTIWEFIK